MPIRKITLPTQLEEFNWIALEIRAILEAGGQTHDIAVISRKHDTLKAILPILQYYHIPVYYELGQNIFDKPRIQELLNMVKFVDSLVSTPHPESDNYLVEILSYPFWGLEPQSVWQISILAGQTRQTWLQTMLQEEVVLPNNQDSHKIKQIAQFFISLGTKAKSQNAEKVLDILLGVSGEYTPDSTYEEEDGGNTKVELSVQEDYVSPFKAYYFDQPLEENLFKKQSNPNNYNYLTFLSNLRVLVQAVRGHNREATFTIHDLVVFLDLLHKNNIPLIDNSPYDKNDQCVSLLTAHKSKGLEFEHVFVLSATQSTWVGKGYGQKLTFPSNLSLSVDKDQVDDKLRLFFVAITRAKKHLSITTFESDDKGKEVQKLSFLQDDWEKISFSNEQKEELLQVYIDADGSKFLEWSKQQKSLLEGILHDYKLSVTHLNNFLDVTKGGPRYFLETNLLRFPQAKSGSASYGTAMHAAIRDLYLEYRKINTIPPISYLLQSFETHLHKERLEKDELHTYLKQGSDNLTLYYNQKKLIINPRSEIEISFRSQAVEINNANINGQIDKMQLNEQSKTIVVTDFKTGKSMSSWKGSSVHEKVKLWRYKQQLYFYKLLVENSRDYGNKYTVNMGELEFLEADNYGQLNILDEVLNNQNATELAELIGIVYQKIIILDFPDTTHYPQDINGIMEFIADLKNRTI